MSESKKKTRIKSMIGPAPLTWADLFKPNTTYKPDGEYRVSVRLSAEEAKKIETQYKAMAKQGLEEWLAEDENKKYKGPSRNFEMTLPIKEEFDKDGNPTGDYIFTAKRDAVWTSKKDNTRHNAKIVVVDAKKNELTSARVGRDSIVKIASLLSFYASPGLKKYGVRASLDAVQILKLVEYSGGGGADAFSEEDGFVSEETEQATEQQTSGGMTEPAGASNGDF